MKKRLKKDPGMIECGEFTLMKSGQTIVSCTTCEIDSSYEFNSLEKFINHIKEYHPQKITTKVKPILSGDEKVSNKRAINRRKKLDEKDIIEKKSKNNILSEFIDSESDYEDEIKKKRKPNKPKKEMPKRQSKSTAEKKFIEAIYSSDDEPLSRKKNTKTNSQSDLNNSTQKMQESTEDDLVEFKPEIHLVEGSNEIFIDSPRTDVIHVRKVSKDEPPVKIEVKSEDEMDFLDDNSSNEEDDINNDSDISESEHKIKKEKFEYNDNTRDTDVLSRTKSERTDESNDYNEDRKHSCTFCGSKFVNAVTLYAHKEKCTKKNEESSKRNSKSVKIKIKFSKRKHSCTNCELKFNNASLLAEHEKTHRDDKNLKDVKQCDVCGKHMNANSLKEHLLRHSGVQPFQCSHCPKAFYNKYALQTHEKGHDPNRTRDFQCELCDKNYSRMPDLKKHVKYVHLNERPAPCMCDLCGKSFTFRFNLKYHMRRHLNVKPVKCDQCDMTFVERGDLNKHKISHNPDFKPYQCDVCSVSFSRKITLTKHQKLHTGLKEYVCKICGKAFAQSPGLYMHMKSHGFNKKPEGAGYYERASHLMFRDMKRDCS